MDLQATQFTYNFDTSTGKFLNFQVTLTGSNSDNEYLNNQIRVHENELGEGKNYTNVTMVDVVAIARKKLADYVAVKDTSAQANNQ